MYFDALTTAAVAAELRAELLGGRVQQVLIPDHLCLALELYAHRQRRYLFASAHPQAARLHLVSDKPRRGPGGLPPLLLLLRKYVRGGCLVDVHQPPAERILHLAFEGPQGPVTLIVEAIGRYSNLVLVAEDGTVLDAIKRVGPDINRYRVVLPGHTYTPPPAQDKLRLADVTEYRLRQILAGWPPDALLRKVLVEGLAGVSPLVAREVVFRALGDIDARAGQVSQISPLLEACRALALELPQPSMVHEEGQVTAFAPYRLMHLEGWEPVQSMSAALAAYFGAGSGGYQAAKALLFQAIKAGQKRLARRRSKLVEEQEVAGDPESLRQMGEAILAYVYQIEPGQSELVVEWGTGEPPLRVSLDPRLPASENAQDYFRRYRKAQRGASEIPKQLARVQAEREYLDQLMQDLTMADNRPEIDAIRHALAKAGYLKEKRKAPASPAPRPLRFTSPDGFRVWVGKNALQNEDVTFRRAVPDDLWLHARGVPGAHVIVQTEGRTVPEQTVAWAAGLAAYYSRGRDDTQVAIDVVQRRYVRRLKGGRPGQVVYRGERTLQVAPQPPPE